MFELDPLERVPGPTFAEKLPKIKIRHDTVYFIALRILSYHHTAVYFTFSFGDSDRIWSPSSLVIQMPPANAADLSRLQGCRLQGCKAAGRKL